MAKYMSNRDIQEYLEEGLDECGTIEKAFDYLLENEVRDLFEMNRWDEPKFQELDITFHGFVYTVKITATDCIESTNEHCIMDWEWTITTK